MNYYRRYIGDYLKKTSKLSILEHGAYTLLLDYYYADEGPLPADKKEIYRQVRALDSAEQSAVDKILRLFFLRKPDGFHNERADEELSVATKVIEIAKENGKKGGRPPNPEKTQTVTHNITHDITRKEPAHKPAGEPANNHPPTTNLHPPASNLQPPTSNQRQPPSDAAVASSARNVGRPNGSDRENPKTGPTWNAYAEAYERRYRVPPMRNAKVSGMLARFCERIPIDEAPHVAAFFVGSNRGLYVSAKHAVDLLLRDAEGLRTEWATGTRGTETAARQADATAAQGQVWTTLLRESEEQNDPETGKIKE